MRDSKPQRCIQQHEMLKVTRNATNQDKHINEASKQNFAYTLFKLSCKYTQGMLSNWKVSFNVFNTRIYGNFLSISCMINESLSKTANTNFPI